MPFSPTNYSIALQTPNVTFNADTIDRIYTLTEVYEILKPNSKRNGFVQRLRMTSTITHAHTTDTPFSRILDSLGFTRNVRSLWVKNGMSSKAKDAIITHYKYN